MGEVSNGFVVVMGIGIVFIGLICIVLLCKILSLLCGNKADKPVSSVSAPPPATSAPIENRQEIIAAVSAVAAEELGTDISAIRIVSFKKL